LYYFLVPAFAAAWRLRFAAQFLLPLASLNV
jgi:hypothetical protein